MSQTISFVRKPDGSLYPDSVTLGPETTARQKFIAHWVSDPQPKEQRSSGLDLWQAAAQQGYRSESISV